MAKMRVLATGISGRIGKHVVPALQEAYELRTLDRYPTELDPNVVISDLQDMSVLKQAMEGVEWLARQGFRTHVAGRAAFGNEDEAAMRTAETAPAPVRLLPSGDAYFLLAGAERELLVPRAEQRERLWTSRVWPGALLVEGEIRGTWRRAQHTVRVDAWSRLSRGTRAAIEAEAGGLPLPGLAREIEVGWET